MIKTLAPDVESIFATMTALGMNRFWYLLLITGFDLVLSGKRGLKQRLEETNDEAAQEPSSSSTRPSSSSTQARGGIRGRASADPGVQRANVFQRAHLLSG